MPRIAAFTLLCSITVFAQGPKYGLGRPATPEEIRAVDISVTADGAGLPPGKGTAAEGKDLYSRRCSKCHGAKGDGGESEVPLAGGQGTLASPKPLKTVGSFWPHATTLWDYINRAMPFKEPGLLTHDQVYQATAFVLHLNGIIGENDVMDAKSLPKVKMPNRDGFVKDPRPDTGRKKGK